MNNNLTEIIFLIDKSGSMFSLTEDTIGGFNGFVAGQRARDGQAVLTTVLFSTDRKTLYSRRDIREVEPMTSRDYCPYGQTALLDAIGDTISEVQDKHDELPDTERPAHVLFVITTDGHENSSTTYKKSQIRKMVEHQRKGHGWEFIFLGADMDSMDEAYAMGITHTSPYIADSIGINTVYTSVSAAADSLRSTGQICDDWDSSALKYVEAVNTLDSSIQPGA